MQFTKSGLSGICIFNLSSRMYGDISDKYTVTLDLAPMLSHDELKIMLNSAAKSRKHLEASDCFSGIFSRPITLYILKRAKIPPSKSVSALIKNDIDIFAKMSKCLSFKITGRSDFSAAQVTAGGRKGKRNKRQLYVKKAQRLVSLRGDIGYLGRLRRI